MGLLSGPIAFETYHAGGQKTRQFGPKHVETLEQFAIGQVETSSTDQAIVGFLAGKHLFDVDFDLEKNVIGDALHCDLRIDTNQIPAAIRRAWMQMELAAVTADAPGGRPTKAQRQEAREAVDARCEEEARSGKFRRMQQFPLLWDARESLVYFGGSGSAGEHCVDLCARAFDLELQRRTAGRRARDWAAGAKRQSLLDAVGPSAFRPGEATAQIAWNDEAGNLDFLGNEFLLWLWWRWETESDTFSLPDDTEVTGMLARTLSLECPLAVSGKETISAEAPASLPEAAQAIRSGKLPRKAGIILVRLGVQYELVLQAETFAVSGAKIHTDETAEGRGAMEDRVESLRELNQTLDLLFHAFCERRVAKTWSRDLERIRAWLSGNAAKRKRTA
jgi:hypothetical protein